jgi:hypothetical protein
VNTALEPGASTSSLHALELHLAPQVLAAWLAVFRPRITAPVWNNVLVLVAGAVLEPGKRTVTRIGPTLFRGGSNDFRLKA